MHCNHSVRIAATVAGTPTPIPHPSAILSLVLNPPLLPAGVDVGESMMKTGVGDAAVGVDDGDVDVDVGVEEVVVDVGFDDVDVEEEGTKIGVVNVDEVVSIKVSSSATVPHA
jgi:hypothetical protein